MSAEGLAKELSKVYPIQHPISYSIEPSSNLLNYELSNDGLVQVSTHFAQEPWAKLLQRLQTETVYTHPDSFRWRKSKIRTAFLDSITGTVIR